VQNAISVPFDVVVAFYVLIHMPIEEQAALIQHLGNWVKVGVDRFNSMDRRGERMAGK
jgi:2-polyprenyl-3-methyl-5-hydroxy-6-metoxy-1,4-benzoquinol methylase